MFDKHKRESLLLRDLLKKLIIIVMVPLLQPMALHLHCMQDLVAPRSQCYGRVSLKRFT